jgi:hypothetical protein
MRSTKRRTRNRQRNGTDRELDHEKEKHDRNDDAVYSERDERMFPYVLQ